MKNERGDERELDREKLTRERDAGLCSRRAAEQRRRLHDGEEFQGPELIVPLYEFMEAFHAPWRSTSNNCRWSSGGVQSMTTLDGSVSVLHGVHATRAVDIGCSPICARMEDSSVRG
jgi:hypothetical protein